MPQCCYLIYQNNGMASTIGCKFPVRFLMPLLWQKHSPLIFTSFLSAVSRCSEHGSSHTIQRATMAAISMSCHTKFDLVLITLFPFLIVKYNSFVWFFLICFVGWRINNDLSSLIAHELWSCAISPKQAHVGARSRKTFCLPWLTGCRLWL